MSGLLAFTKMAFAAPRLTMALGANTMAARAYATKKLFIGNIAWGTTDEEVTEFFAQYGELKDVHFPKDHNGRTKGFGFVELEEEDADKAIEGANGREFNGREIRVDAANARPDRERGSRGDFQGEFRPRREFNNRDGRDGRDGRGDRQFRPRRDDGERSFRPRRDNNEGGERSFRPRGDSRDE